MPAVHSKWMLSILASSLALAFGVGVPDVAQARQGVTTAYAPTQEFASLTVGMQKQTGLFDIWTSAEHAKVLLGVAELHKPFLLVTSLPFGLGSNDVGLDRGQVGASKLVRFERHGKRLFLVQENTRYVADSPNADERASVREAFAGAVLWAGDILGTETSNGNVRYLIDFSSFLLVDRHGVADSLSRSRQGNYQLDDKRSAVLSQQAKSFPDNTELEAMLTLTGAGEGPFVRQVAADAKSLRVHQHISLIRLPVGYVPRAYHPGSGGIDSEKMDFATPLADSINVRWQLRHRLEKTDSNAALSPVKKPIVYYLDRGTPEPVRSALLEGARWWGTAFEKAGFKDAYRVELLPEGVDPMDIRYNTIMWVHRATRGWSYGNAVSDPRTGEIIKGHVNLGSLRVRQDYLIAEGLLAPYEDGKPVSKEMEQMALARLRQLAAHEVGHTIGIAHAYSSSTENLASVMDYPHPIAVLKDGKIDLSNAYDDKIGALDKVMVAYGYQHFPNGTDEDKALNDIIQNSLKAGLTFLSDQDARPVGGAHPFAHL